MSSDLPRLLTACEVASLLRVHVYTFQLWCRRGDGPPGTRIGSLTRYAEDDVHAWLEARKRSA